MKVKEAFHKSVDCRDCALLLRELAVEQDEDGDKVNYAADLLMEYADHLCGMEVSE